MSGNEPAQGEITGCFSLSWDCRHATAGNWKNTAFHVGWGLGDGLRGPLAAAPVGIFLSQGSGAGISFLSQSIPYSSDLKVLGPLLSHFP